jgi:hypothetical protein
VTPAKAGSIRRLEKYSSFFCFLSSEFAVGRKNAIAAVVQDSMTGAFSDPPHLRYHLGRMGLYFRRRDAYLSLRAALPPSKSVRAAGAIGNLEIVSKVFALVEVAPVKLQNGAALSAAGLILAASSAAAWAADSTCPPIPTISTSSAGSNAFSDLLSITEAQLDATNLQDGRNLAAIWPRLNYTVSDAVAAKNGSAGADFFVSDTVVAPGPADSKGGAASVTASGLTGNLLSHTFVVEFQSSHEGSVLLQEP